jgi:RAD50-interacting protein 1
METTEDRDVRVADYLDDKLQILGDLDALDSLLSNIRDQHGLLKKQVRRAQRVSSAYADTWIARRCRKRPRGS